MLKHLFYVELVEHICMTLLIKNDLNFIRTLRRSLACRQMARVIGHSVEDGIIWKF